MTHKGILFIGDPHVASRVPGFRCDDYPDVVLDKLAWCMDYAQQEELRTAILGDLFHFPRDNANRLLARLIDILSGQCPLAIYGNHDVHENQLTMDDSLSVVAASGAIQLLDRSCCRDWRRCKQQQNQQGLAEALAAVHEPVNSSEDYNKGSISLPPGSTRRLALSLAG